MEKLAIDMGDFNLVAEKCDGVGFAMYFQDKKTDCITQDVAMVRRTLENGEPLPNAAECLIWTDDSDENYTHKFIINQYLEAV